MHGAPALSKIDTAELRKARGAFFTPDPISKFVTSWAVREVSDAVLEPSAGDASFLVQAARRLRELADNAEQQPTVHGVEIHPHSAQTARERVLAEGGAAAHLGE